VVVNPSSLLSKVAPGKFNNVVAAPLLLLHLEAAEVAAGETDDDLLKRITR
jgi:hypothetical protein